MEKYKNKNIVICGSCKFHKEMEFIANQLRKDNNLVVHPKMVPFPQSNLLQDQLANRKFYFNAINNANIVLIYNKDGYVGIATVAELMFAIFINYNLKKKIELFYEPSDIGVKAILAFYNGLVRVNRDLERYIFEYIQ